MIEANKDTGPVRDEDDRPEDTGFEDAGMSAETDDALDPGKQFGQMDEILAQLREMGGHGERVASVILAHGGRLEMAKLRTLERDQMLRSAKSGDAGAAGRSLQTRIDATKQTLAALESVYARFNVAKPDVPDEYAVVYGRVVSGTGEPVANARVVAEGSRGKEVGRGRSDADGRYELRIRVGKPEAGEEPGAAREEADGAPADISGRVRLTVRDGGGRVLSEDKTWHPVRRGHASYHELAAGSRSAQDSGTSVFGAALSVAKVAARVAATKGAATKGAATKGGGKKGGATKSTRGATKRTATKGAGTKARKKAPGKKKPK